jgi:hypothetical protein
MQGFDSIRCPLRHRDLSSCGENHIDIAELRWPTRLGQVRSVWFIWSLWSLWSIWLIWFIWLVSFNQITRQTEQTT